MNWHLKKTGRLVIVSNRLPFTIARENNGYAIKRSSGGLVSGLTSWLKSWGGEYIWVGWPGACPDESVRQELLESAMRDYCACPVFLPEEQMERFYQGFCNTTIWPLFHYFPSLAGFKEEHWEIYKEVNRIFCDAVAEIINPDDIIWIHDYHLFLLPEMLRGRIPDLTMGLFLHIPFPSFEMFRLMPRAWGTKIIEGMLGADLLGFHTHDFTQYFLRSVLRYKGSDHNLGVITLRSRTVKADTFPMGIEFEKFHCAMEIPEVQKERNELLTTFSDRKVIFSVDRLDYTKGILNRLAGYEFFLETNPDWRGKVVFVLVVVPSRIGIEHYQEMKNRIDSLVGKINGRFGDVNWAPIVYQFRSVEFPFLAAMYNLSAIALITPLRDGMNLVAKEYIASRTDNSGVLILSEMAGASKELGEAIIINPNHKEDIARALKDAVEMPLEEQAVRVEHMQNRLKTYDIARWANDFLVALDRVKETQRDFEARLLNSSTIEAMRKSFRDAQRKLIFLDYDGTLVPYAPQPMHAVPDQELCKLLNFLARDIETDLVLISGRDRSVIDKWFGAISMGFVAENGAWIKGKEEQWRLLRPLNSEWKKALYPILKVYADRLPGAFIEQKEHSLVWHFRQADPEHASLRARELVDQLTEFTANIDIQVLRGSKVVEIRNSGISKASAAMSFLSSQSYDFILAIGDDWTDEDLFKVLPVTAYTIKVGITQSHARYNVTDYKDSRMLLKEISQ